MNRSISPDVFKGTPTISVIDNRGLAVRSVQYNRLSASSALECLITRSTYNSVGQLSGASDPRLFDNGVENQSQINSLTGQTLRIDSVDAGWRVALLDIEGGVHKEWDELGITRRYAYDAPLHRPLAIHEKRADINSGIEQITERFVYGDSSQTDDNLNLQLIQHYDQGGLVETCSISLTGQPLIQQRQLLSSPTVESDWQGDESDWNGQLGSEVYKTTWGYNALGVMLAQLDATGNRQRSEYDVSGALSASYLLLANQVEADEQILVSEIDYNANGQKTFECAGNGVTTTYSYDERDWRLITMLTERPSNGTRSIKLQELNYTYDPVGNILLIEDKAVATRFYKNQRIEPKQSYVYDALYQLISARGRENATNQPSNSSLPTPSIPIPTDSNQLRNYTRTYTYDSGGNLSQIQHAPDGSPGYTLSMVVSERSNRTLQQTAGAQIDVGDVDNHFDAHGNLLQLEQSKGLTWGRYNQLKQVELTDKQQEVYQYAAQGARIRKMLIEGSNESEMIYLPGLELRNKRGAINETLHVISLSNTGRNQVRLLHWVTETPDGIDNDQLRYSLDNHLGSSHLELDSHGDVLTQEEYYPFGGTAVWSAKNTSEAKYKYVRYSGKERDATGLYYHGYRYYMPWMGRWLNPDPAWTVDGLNLYRMVRNNPVLYFDPNGNTAEEWETREMFKELPFSSHEQGLRDLLAVENDEKSEKAKRTRILLEQLPFSLPYEEPFNLHSVKSEFVTVYRAEVKEQNVRFMHTRVNDGNVDIYIPNKAPYSKNRVLKLPVEAKKIGWYHASKKILEEQNETDDGNMAFYNFGNPLRALQFYEQKMENPKEKLPFVIKSFEVSSGVFKAIAEGAVQEEDLRSNPRSSINVDKAAYNQLGLRPHHVELLSAAIVPNSGQVYSESQHYLLMDRGLNSLNVSRKNLKKQTNNHACR